VTRRSLFRSAANAEPAKTIQRKTKIAPAIFLYTKSPFIPLSERGNFLQAVLSSFMLPSHHPSLEKRGQGRFEDRKKVSNGIEVKVPFGSSFR
jgi:hypothetical protein